MSDNSTVDLTHLPLPLQNIIHSFNQLKDDVCIALLTQLGDAARLELHVQACEHLKIDITQHHAVVPEAILATMESSLDSMVADLDQAKGLSADYPDAPPIDAVTTIQNRCWGRPRVEIDPDVLETALQFAGPTRLGDIFGVSSRTVCRRALENELVEPGQPVYIEFTDEDGITQRYYTSSTAAQSSLPNDELDAIMLQILTQYPRFRCHMIDGLIRWKIVIHGFIDGYS
ncbi:hypothetical protein EDB19DRAFT_1831289 [Suillus lakei]|nr:hypothetical protein EDB19DRAFT_1831289 [Suillus lakei]